MKRVLTVLGLAGAVGLAGCLDDGVKGKSPGTDPMFRYHFAGRTALHQGTNASRLRAVETLPATAVLRAELSRKLAAGAIELWRVDLPAGASNQTGLLQPIFNDLMDVEAFVEVRGPIGKIETVIAAELTDERARLWSTNLWRAATAWKFSQPAPVNQEGVTGWESTRSQAPANLQWRRAGKWVLVGFGKNPGATLQPLAERIARTSRPFLALTNGFLDVRADLPALGKWFPILAQFPLPPAQLAMIGRGENVRTEVRFIYPEKVSWALEPWKIPTNLVTEPLTSFTVARGIAPLLDRVNGFSRVGLKPTPSQLCAWGISNDQCRAYFALPVPNATNAIRQIASTAPVFVLDRFTNSTGHFLYVSNRAELLWTGIVPYVAPFLRATGGPDSEYLFGGNFPPYPKTFPVPDALYAQFRDRNDLLYYDWEDTPQRLDHARQFLRLATMLDWRQPDSTNTPSQLWLSAIRPHLANTATEIAQTGPRELTFIRRSQVGFTGFELMLFSAWLDSPRFPFEIQLPPAQPSHVRKPATPAGNPR